MTDAERTQCAREFNQNLRPWIEDLVKRELAHQLKLLKRDLLADVTATSLRALISDTIERQIDVTVAVK